MLGIPAPLQQLGAGQELRAALLKLSAALPPAQRHEQQAAIQRIHLDARWWGQSDQPAPHLEVVQRAVWQARHLEIVTRTVHGVLIEQLVDPLGLVAKAGEWYLVARLAGGMRVYRISSLVKAACQESTFVRPEDFDLPAFWESDCQQVEAERGMFWVELRASPALLAELPLRLGEDAESLLDKAGPPDDKGWRTVKVAFDNFDQARRRILSFGGGAEVMEPLPLRRSILDYAHQILKVYQA